MALASALLPACQASSGELEVRQPTCLLKDVLSIYV